MRLCCALWCVLFTLTLAAAQEADYCPEANPFYNASNIDQALEKYQACRIRHWENQDYSSFFETYWMVLDCIAKRQETRALLTELTELRNLEQYVPAELKASNAHVIKQFEFLLNRMTGDLGVAADIQHRLLDSLMALPGPPDKDRLGRIFKSLMYLSEVYLDQGSYRQALYYANGAVSTGKEIFDYARTDGFILTPNYVLVRTYLLTGDYLAALGELNSILEIIPGIEERQSERRIRTFIDLARLHNRLGDVDSVDHYVTLLVGEPAADQFTLSIKRLQAKGHISRGGYVEAEKIYRMLVDSLEATGEYNVDVFAEMNVELGDLYSTYLSNPKEALERYQTAIYALSSDTRSDAQLVNPNLDAFFTQPTAIAALKGKAEALMALAGVRLDEGAEEYEKAAWRTISLGIDLVNEMRTGYQTAEDRAKLIEESYFLYQTGLEFCLEMQARGTSTWVDTAYNLMEGSKALNLHDDLTHNEARKLAGIPDSLIGLELAIMADINQLKKRERDLRKAPEIDQDKLRNTLSLIQSAERSRDSLVAVFETDYPDYAELKNGPGLITLIEAQAQIKRDESVLEFFVASATSEPFLLVFDKDSKGLMRCSAAAAANDDIHAVAKSFNETLEDEAVTIENARLLNALHRLYEWLVAPAGALRKHIVIIPDGYLHSLPFGAFLTEKPTQTHDLRDQPYLIKEASILYSYSSRLNYGLRLQTMPKVGKSYAFSPSIDPSTGFLPLPMGEVEAEEVGKRVGAQVISGLSCTVSSVKRIMREEDHFKIMHFATHGIADLDHGADSYLQFSGTSDTSRLYAYDLYEQDFDAALVYLSACQTATGSQQSGEGIISLARAFFRSGANNLVTTVWNVGDRQAEEITGIFYEQLLMGQRVDVALAEAQRTYTTSLANDERHLAHPAYWSGFVAFGNASPIFPRFSGIWLWIGVGLTLSVAGAYFFRKRPSRR